MYEYNEKSGSGIRNVENEDSIYPTGGPIHKTKEDIRPLPESAKPEQEKKSDTHYVGESSKGVKKTNMNAVKDGNKKNEGYQPHGEEDELIEKTSWETPQPDKDKDVPL